MNIAVAQRDLYTWTLFEDWCTAEDHSALPTTPQTLAQFVHAHSPRFPLSDAALPSLMHFTAELDFRRLDEVKQCSVPSMTPARRDCTSWLSEWVASLLPCQYQVGPQRYLPAVTHSFSSLPRPDCRTAGFRTCGSATSPLITQTACFGFAIPQVQRRSRPLPWSQRESLLRVCCAAGWMCRATTTGTRARGYSPKP